VRPGGRDLTAYVGRFAPSPTGPLHFGSLVAALASFCDARFHGGDWHVRIEDVDAPRSRPGAEREILATLERYGMTWDGPIVRQTERTPAYDGALARLQAQGDVYACTCTRRELESAPLGAGGERVYPGTCRDGHRVDARSAQAIRVRVRDATIEFTDLLQGPQQQALASDVGDFVVRRADGLFAYQLAVVVDDADLGATTVVRGADLLSSTPRQIWLQQRLALPTPEYLHVPVAINAAGEKLSKQTDALALPDDPVPALMAAWRFLAQPLPDARPDNAAAFLRYATRAWSRHALPPVAMLLAPRGC